MSYGARVINEGGVQSVPKLSFPGGVLVGCAAGFVNVPKIKGTHTAMKSGMVAADEAYKALKSNGKSPTADGADGAELAETAKSPLALESFDVEMRKSWAWKELWQVRNCRPAFHTLLGLYGGVLWSGLEVLLLKGRHPFTFKHGKPDWATLTPAADATKIDYPKPDGVLSFDLLTNLTRSGTNHDHD